MTNIRASITNSAGQRCDHAQRLRLDAAIARDPPLWSATWWPRRLSGAVPNRTICRQASRRYPVVIVCAVTTWRDREPQEGGQRPDRGAGSVDHASLVVNGQVLWLRTLVPQQHLLRLPFAGRLLRRAVDGTRPSCGRERVKQEMLVSEVIAHRRPAAAACTMAGAQGQVELRETPYPVIRGARRVCVPIRRVPRGAGVRMSPEPATVTAPPAGQAFGCTVQARRNTMQERACHGSRRRDTRPALSDLPFPCRPRPAPRCVGCPAPG